jgi:hypothetical protein
MEKQVVAIILNMLISLREKRAGTAAGLREEIIFFMLLQQ